MVVKSKKSKKITRRKTTRKRRLSNPINPSIAQIKKDIEVDTKPLGNNKFLISIKYLDQHISEYVVNGEMLKYVQTRGKDAIAHDIQQIALKANIRKNPDVKDKKNEDKVGSLALGSVGLPATPREAWLTGYDQGLKEGISLCGLTDYFRRREIREELAKRTEQHFDDFAEQMRASGKIIGAKVPKIRGI